MTVGEQDKTFSCDPESIWKLDEAERAPAVIAMFRDRARQYVDAIERRDTEDAQDLAVQSIAAIGGLFPDPDDPAHRLLGSLLALITDARSGRFEHILSGRSDSLGLKRGYKNAFLAGFAISAVLVLTERRLVGAGRAQIEVANLLATAGVSLRTGDHNQPKSITQSALRSWQDNAEKYPLQHHIAVDMMKKHAANLGSRSDPTLADVLAYLREQALQVLELCRGM